MKKLFIVALSLIMLFSFTACNSKVDKEPPMSVTSEEYTPSPFADTNASKRYYFADQSILFGGTV